VITNRIIGRLDLKGDSVVKGIQMDGLRKIGRPEELALTMSEAGADELLLVDVVASLYNRDNIFKIIEFVALNLRIPLTVVGGIRNFEDASKIFDAGADKIGINSAGIQNPYIYEELANKYGSQAIVASIESKKNRGDSAWVAMTDNGRTSSGIDISDWCTQVQNVGVGEILITSVDADGMQKGPDLNLIELVSKNIQVPLVYSGGVRNFQDCANLLNRKVDAIAIASALHYKKTSITEVKTELLKSGFNIRNTVL
jgi:cyclase